MFLDSSCGDFIWNLTVVCSKRGVDLKEWESVQVGHHKKIGKVCEEYQKKGWRLHTYQATGPYMGEINHYLLFERETDS